MLFPSYAHYIVYPNIVRRFGIVTVMEDKYSYESLVTDEEHRE